MSLGLVLSGGGARAAYQVGALAAVADICAELKIENPFAYYTGVSAGAINATMLCAHSSGHFFEAVQELKRLWLDIEANQVYKSDALSLSVGGLQWLAGLSLGGISKSSAQKSLLNSSPLRDLLKKNCAVENIQNNITNKKFKALAISALDYHCTSTVTFIQGEKTTASWRRVRRQSELTSIEIEHVLASASIPVLFPPVNIDTRYFGDGCIRNHAPCAPAIYMGADRILAIGVRKKIDTTYTPPTPPKNEPPSVGRIANVLLNAVMMDGMEMDLERLERINEHIAQFSEKERSNLSVKPVSYLWLAPSREISEIAAQKVNRLPAMIRYLLKGLGSLQDASEIASFLLFESSYCKELIELGFEDTMKQKEQLLLFLNQK